MILSLSVHQKSGLLREFPCFQTTITWRVDGKNMWCNECICCNNLESSKIISDLERNLWEKFIMKWQRSSRNMDYTLLYFAIMSQKVAPYWRQTQIPDYRHAWSQNYSFTNSLSTDYVSCFNCNYTCNLKPVYTKLVCLKTFSKQNKVIFKL